jgi:flagellar motor protein MotB
MLTFFVLAGVLGSGSEAEQPPAFFSYGPPQHVIEAERAKEKARKEAERQAEEAEQADAKEQERQAQEAEERRQAVQAAVKVAVASYREAQSLTALAQEVRAITMAEAVQAAIAQEIAFAAIVAAQAEELRRLEAEALAIAQAEYERRLLQEQDDLAVMLLLAA